MDTKIQELTNKIYLEGVAKGQEEAARLIAEAKAEREAILKAAKEEATHLVALVRKEAGDLKVNTEAELKMYAAQSVEALKSEIVNHLNEKVVTKSVAIAARDATFMHRVILEMTKEWVKKEHLIIETPTAETLTAYFEAHAKELLASGVKIEKVNGKATSFHVLPRDGSYKVSFGEDEFIAYFKEFLRPKLVEMLF